MAYIWSKFSFTSLLVETRAREGEHPTPQPSVGSPDQPFFAPSTIETVHRSELKYVLQMAKVLNTAMEKKHNERN